ncbi:hypothetical protein AVEN_184399-1 [Araneus ventricosus]|uniref:Uncharacterized protein n=1 Tax=Araneus ventricosus TaxID=182803 RepID=A0A4Y2BGZ1_ARAVE|nr:hypothetical protein AVEN_184399-1 [Araneus ventricosus]
MDRLKFLVLEMNRTWSPSGRASASGSDVFQVRNPITSNVLHVLDLLHDKSYVESQAPSHWDGAEVWKGGCQLKFRQNYEVRPKIAFDLLQSGTLI